MSQLSEAKIILVTSTTVLENYIEITPVGILYIKINNFILKITKILSETFGNVFVKRKEKITILNYS